MGGLNLKLNFEAQLGQGPNQVIKREPYTIKIEDNANGTRSRNHVAMTHSLERIKVQNASSIGYLRTQLSPTSSAKDRSLTGINLYKLNTQSDNAESKFESLTSRIAKNSGRPRNLSNVEMTGPFGKKVNSGMSVGQKWQAKE